MSECVRELLARSVGCNVARCTCGHFHVTVGPVTLRLDEATLAEAASTLDVAVRRIETEGPRPTLRLVGANDGA